MPVMAAFDPLRTLSAGVGATDRPPPNWTKDRINSVIISLYAVVVSGSGTNGMDNGASSEQARMARRLLASLEADLSGLIERRDPYSAGIAHELQKAIDRIRAIR